MNTRHYRRISRKAADQLLDGAAGPDQAEAVLLRAVLGLDAITAGQVLGKRPGAIRTAAHRGLKTLHKKLDRAKEPPPADVPRPAGAAQPAGVTQPARVTQTRGLTLKDVR